MYDTESTVKFTEACRLLQRRVWPVIVIDDIVCHTLDLKIPCIRFEKFLLIGVGMPDHRDGELGRLGYVVVDCIQIYRDFSKAEGRVNSGIYNEQVLNPLS